MMKLISKSVPASILGFAAGILFLMSCGGNGNSPVNEAGATVPQTTDQMVCKAWYDFWFDSTSTINCQKKLDATVVTYTNVNAILSDGWTAISVGGGDRQIMLFYK